MVILSLNIAGLIITVFQTEVSFKDYFCYVMLAILTINYFIEDYCREEEN
jgi:hypothetical protein